MNNKLNLNINIKNNILKILNKNYTNEKILVLNISNIRLINDKYMLYIYD
jgi:hypothetical protein